MEVSVEFVRKKCHKCDSQDVTTPIPIPDTCEWLATYTCNACGAHHKINYGDKMDGGFDTIEVC